MSTPSNRKNIARASLTRKTTRGPLDEDDPLSVSSTTLSSTSPAASALKSSLVKSPTISTLDQQSLIERDLIDNENEGTVNESATTAIKDLSFLLDAAIYHPLSTIDIPTPFRKALPAVPKSSQSLRDITPQIKSLISNCDFLGAAHLAAICLTSGKVESSDYNSIFGLLATRYSCLELSGNVVLAAQEAKALEDLMSGFYYLEQPVTNPETDASPDHRPLPKHIMPFPLRIQAIRLQNMGFSDPRRGVAALYDLGSECRENIASPFTTTEERQVWLRRLDELGIRVVNALIELGDLDCALRTLKQLRPINLGQSSLWASRMILLYLKVGDISEAQLLVRQNDFEGTERAMLSSLIAIAQDQMTEAVRLLSSDEHDGQHLELMTLAKQNLAVAYLYTGKIQAAREVMEELIDEGNSFQTLTINLATMYDLTSDNSRESKMNLVNNVAKIMSHPRSFTNADFKL